MQLHSSREVEVWGVARPHKDLELRLPFGHLAVQVALVICGTMRRGVVVLEVLDAITFEPSGASFDQSLDVRYCMLGEDSVVVPFPIWENTPLKQLQTLAHSMPNRGGEVVDNEGWSIMY